MNEGISLPAFEYTPSTIGRISEAKYDAILQSYDKGSNGIFSAEQLKEMRIDIAFAQEHPDLPLENVASRWSNYIPQNESQEDMTRMMSKLLQAPNEKLSGMLVHGDPGIGKTHISVAFAKKAMAEGKKSIYINLPRLKGLGKELLQQEFDVLILDDWNSAYGIGSGLVREAIALMHDRGGRLFITSNTKDPYNFLETGLSFAGDKSDLMRLADRVKGSIRIQEVIGNSQRSANSWWEDHEQLKP